MAEQPKPITWSLAKQMLRRAVDAVPELTRDEIDSYFSTSVWPRAEKQESHGSPQDP